MGKSIAMDALRFKKSGGIANGAATPRNLCRYDSDREKTWRRT